MSKKFSISLLHPFSAKAIGLSKKDLLYSHSKPHFLALQEIQKENFKITVDYFTTGIFPQVYKIDGLIKYLWPTTFQHFNKNKRWRNEKSYWHLLYNTIKPPDITIINMSGHLSPYSLKIAKALMLKGKTYIAMVGGLNMSFGEKEMAYYKNAHHIIVHTEIQKHNLLQRKEFENLDIRVIPLGVNTSHFTPLTNKDLDKVNLLFVGRISRLKRVEMAIETLAFCLQNNLQANLTIVGPVSDEVYYNELLNIIRERNLEEFVNMIGPVCHEDLVEYFQNATLLLLPSIHESFGMVLIESMACGTPVAALKNSVGPDEIITDSYTGILAENANYSQNIVDLIHNPVKYAQLSRNCRQSVVEKWSISNTIELMRDSLNSALNENKIKKTR